MAKFIITKNNDTPGTRDRPVNVGTEQDAIEELTLTELKAAIRGTLKIVQEDGHAVRVPATELADRMRMRG